MIMSYEAFDYLVGYSVILGLFLVFGDWCSAVGVWDVCLAGRADPTS